MKINFQKVRNFNQLILAIAGSFVAILLITLLVILLVTSINNMINYRSNQVETGIIATEEAEELVRDSMRKQIVSFSTLSNIDSVRQLFIVPVSQANLKDAESSYDSDYMSSGPGFSKTKFRSYRSDRIYNNLILYNALENESHVIFDFRICVTGYQYHQGKDDDFIVIMGSENDSNKDNVINEKDLKGIYIYELATKQMTKLEIGKSMTVVDIDQPDNADFLIGKLAWDKNGNGTYDKYYEPMIYKRIDLVNKSLIPILEDGQMEKIQQLLEGITSN